MATFDLSVEARLRILEWLLEPRIRTDHAKEIVEVLLNAHDKQLIILNDWSVSFLTSTRTNCVIGRFKALTAPQSQKLCEIYATTRP